MAVYRLRTGPAEVTRAVSVRSRDHGDLGSMPVDDLLQRLKDEAAE